MLFNGRVTGAIDSAGDTGAGGGVGVSAWLSIGDATDGCLGSFAPSGSVASGLEKLFVGDVFGAGLV